MAKRIATMSGTFLAPGVSKNGRGYTAENIASGVQAIRDRIKNGRPPTVAAGHVDRNRPERVVGHITSVEQAADGTATFEADLFDTMIARDMLNIAGPDGPVRAVSIHGYWDGPVRHTNGVETAPGLDISGIDIVVDPGVEAALIRQLELAEAAPDGRPLLWESAQALITADEAAKAPYGSVAYADPGYQPDKQKRYPVDTEKHVRAAWSYINQAGNQKPYTAKQLARIKSRIKAAGKKLGITFDEGAPMPKALSEQAVDRLTDLVNEADACISLYNNQADIRIGGYLNDPTGLPALIQKLADAANAALACLDPDQDGDIDGIDPNAPEAAQAPDDDQMESAPGSPTKEEPAVTETTESEKDATVTETATPEAPAVVETAAPVETESVETPAAPVALSEDDRSAIAAKLAEALTPNKDHLAEAAKHVLTDVVGQAVTEAMKTVKDDIRAEILKVYGQPKRAGLVEAAKNSEPEKPLHEMSREEVDAYASKAWENALPTP